jgi:hypothetical protein
MEKYPRRGRSSKARFVKTIIHGLHYVLAYDYKLYRLPTTIIGVKLESFIRYIPLLGKLLTESFCK